MSKKEKNIQNELVEESFEEVVSFQESEEEAIAVAEAADIPETPEQEAVTEEAVSEEAPVEEAVAEEAEAPEDLPAAPEAEAAPAEEAVVIAPPVFEEPVADDVVADLDAPIAEEVDAVPPKKPEKVFTRKEKKLRKKYKMHKDSLLSENDVVPGFVIAHGEKVIRSYDCLASKKGDGTVCLTNKRLLVNANERSEIGIDEISGIRFSKYSRFFFLKFLFALLLTVIAAFFILLPLGVLDRMNIHVASLASGETRTQWAVILSYVGGGIAALIALPLWLTTIRKTFYFYVYAHQGTPFVECKNESFFKREKKGKVAACMLAKAGRESEKAARELGALIIEAKEGRFED